LSQEKEHKKEKEAIEVIEAIEAIEAIEVIEEKEEKEAIEAIEAIEAKEKEPGIITPINKGDNIKMKNITSAIVITAVFFCFFNLLLTAGTPASIYDFEMKDIDGNQVPLSQFKDKVILIVNVASKCGNTPQYQGLQEIYSKYKEKGFVILGFPANNFRQQEPGTDAEIKEFCTVNYGVQFPMFSKISVLGEDIHPLYRFLTSTETDPKFAGDIRWNFDKFLVDKHGTIINRFHPKIKPQDPELITAIETALSSK